MKFDLDKLISKEDISYEESISREPHNISTWLSYYNFKINALFDNRLFILYRAVSVVPDSKELWKNLLELILQEGHDIHPNSIKKYLKTV